MTSIVGGVSVVIPAFDSRALLEKNLRALLTALKAEKFPAEIIVSDDGSTDETADWLGREHPGVKVLRSERRLGFQRAVAGGLDAAAFELVYFLNTDVEVLPGFLEPLRAHFERADTFAASSRPLKESAGAESSDELPVVRFRRGIWWHRYVSTRVPLRHPVPTLFVSMGHGLFRKSMLRDLGFLDPRFEPFYFEDQDICLRAWRRGWRCLYEPKSTVRCRHQATIGRIYSQTYIRRIHWRNRFLFQWKNLPGWSFRLREILWLPWVALGAPLLKRGEVSAGLASALFRRIVWRTAPDLSTSAANGTVSVQDILEAFRRPPQERYRILHLHDHAIVGGAERSIALLAEPRGRGRFEAIVGLGGRGAFEEVLKQAGIPAALVEIPSLRFWRFDRWLWHSWRLARWMREQRVDLVHGHTPRSNLYAWLAGRLAGVPVVWHLRNVLEPGMRDVEKWLKKWPDTILCNSEEVRRRLEPGKPGSADFSRGARRAISAWHRGQGSTSSSCGAGRAEVIYTGVDTERFSPLGPEERSRVRREMELRESQIAVAIVGRIGSKQGHEEFLLAASRVVGKRPDCVFFVVGGAQFPEDGPHEARARSLVRELGLEGRVVFTGHIEAVAPTVGAMDILVFPSRFEAFSRAVLEAMACARPIVASWVGGMLEAVVDGETGRLVPPRDAESLAEAILELAADLGKRARWGRAARARAEELFSARRTLDATQEVYRRLLEGFPGETA
ncbi:MAG: glycosyltransferase [Elusimicrobia bacterium]|nr:glycosyltransferase [Elusimicrobiota bacterium]